jgi:hypothetical protein
VGTTTTTAPPAPNVAPFNPLTYAQAKSVSTSAWALGLLTLIRAPITANNLSNVQLWIHNEQSAGSWAADATNPLGVSGPNGVQPQGNVLAGLTLTASTLQSGSYNAIVNALRNNAPTPIFAGAVIASPWNTGKTGGSTYAGRTLNQFIAMGPLVTGSTSNNGIVTQMEQGQAGSVVTPVVGAVKAVTSVGGLIGKITDPTNLKNVGIFVGGLALTVTGLVILFSATKGKQVLEVAGKVA